MQKYDHSKIEKKWQKKWEDTEAFKTSDSSDKPKQYVLDMFPYPSGAGLHVGHVEGYTATDIYSRYKRAQGFNVLHPMGWDAFGLPAENYAIKTGTPPQKSTDESINNFRKQIKNLGLSYDWSREFGSHNPEYYKWTQWLFAKFFEKGLVYKKKALVNWDPVDQTVLANEQVLADGTAERSGAKVEKKELEQWFYKITDYADELVDSLDTLDWPESTKINQRNWVGRSEGAQLQFPIVRFTDVMLASNNESKKSRAERLLAAAGLFIAVHTPSSLGIETIDVEENGTLTENAVAKAKSYLGKTSMPIFALDTGFAIEGEDLDPVRPKRNALAGADESSLTQDEIAERMQKFYRDIAKKHGGTVPAKWLDSIALVLPDGSVEVATDEREVVLTDIVHGTPDKYFPVRSLYVSKITGKAANEESTEEEILELQPMIDAHAKLFTRPLAVFTTRPDTLFGATYVVLAPEHPLVAEFAAQAENKDEILRYVESAKAKSEIDRSAEGKEKTGVELKGVRAINPANKKDIPVYIADYVLGNYGTGAIMAVPAYDERDAEFAKVFSLPVVEAELVDAKKAVKDAGGTFVKKYRLRDWLISRQRYWGAPIPIVYDPEGKPHAIPDEHLPWLLPEDVEYQPKGTSPLGTSKELFERTERIFGKGWKPEIDTMDTFACSSWYFFRFADPHNTNEFASKEAMQTWLPVDLYVGGAEHTVLHLLYARFYTKALRDMGYLSFAEPFLKLRHQGIILAEDSRKMSKRWGNVINPDDMVERFGADSVRLYEMFMGPLEAMKPWNTNNVMGVRRFIERVWSLQEKIADIKMSAETETLLNQTIEKVGKDIEALKMNTAVSALMIFSNHMHELTEAPKDAYVSFLQLLAPFAPHACSEIADGLGANVDAWPVFDSSKTLTDKAKIAVQVNGKVRALLELSTTATEEEALALARAHEVVAKWLETGVESKAVYIPGKIINFVVG